MTFIELLGFTACCGAIVGAIFSLLHKKEKLNIGDCIDEIDTGTTKRKPALKIVFQFPAYLPCCTEDYKRLIKGLSQKILNSHSVKMPIRALSLTWDEYEEDFE